MKAKLLTAPPPGDWAYEVKFDGYRALAVKKGTGVELYSRNRNTFASKFPEISAALSKLKVREAVIDGEIVAVDEKGRSAFQLLQAHDIGEMRPPVLFYGFDLLFLNGEDLRHEPLSARRDILRKVLEGAPEKIRFSDTLEGDIRTLLKAGRSLGLEGFIGKRAGSKYEAGERSGAWIKLKLSLEQEFVIGGYTNPKGGRAHFGALLVGYFKGQDLVFAGKIGTGFTEASLKAVSRKLAEHESSQCEFVNLPEKKGSRFSPGLTSSEMRHCHWVKPRLVCQVKFGEWTRDGKLRHPVFLGLREDKAAREVIREGP
jgi:bifunctional non-homologous end joining protein LigD